MDCRDKPGNDRSKGMAGSDAPYSIDFTGITPARALSSS